MKRTILVTGSTDGIGFETAKMLAKDGHTLLLHGRNPQKLAKVKAKINELAPTANLETYTADLSSLPSVKQLANDIAANHPQLDVLINNAGVYNVAETLSPDGLDVRYVVNTIAPYLLTKLLLPVLTGEARVVNLSSAAQAPVIAENLTKPSSQPDNLVYAQSKLAITMWSSFLGENLKASGPMIVAINPKSLLGSKMVKNAYGIAGGDLTLGADILYRAALSAEFSQAGGKYFDNDLERFAPPHQDALNQEKCQKLIDTLNGLIANYV